MKISYRHTIQVQPYETIAMEVERELNEDAYNEFDKAMQELENTVDTELERRAAELRGDDSNFVVE